jgi:hypothetical protein
MKQLITDSVITALAVVLLVARPVRQIARNDYAQIFTLDVVCCVLAYLALM